MTEKPKTLVLGVNGQVGGALNVLLENAVCLSRESADLSRPQTLPEIVKSIRPDILINAAAYTQVDKAENEPELAFTINSEAPEILARTAREMDIPFIHYSSDYVFPGSGEKPWSESDSTAPLNIYGKSKEKGEQAIANIGGKYLILRTSWVYDAYGKNFLNSMLRLGSQLKILKVVNDQFGAPTHAPHLAEATITAIQNAMDNPAFPSGIYHLCASGETSWYGFAEEIFAQARVAGIELKLEKLEPIPASEYPLPTPRPHNSRLDCAKVIESLQLTLPHWKTGVAVAIKEKANETDRLPY